MQQVISLKGDRTLIASYSISKRKFSPWVVFLPESGAGFRHGSRSEGAALAGSKAMAKCNFLVINKPGVGPNSVDRLVFDRSFRRHVRVNDALAALRAIVPKTGRIHLVGYSEGAYLAPQIAKLDSRIKSITMIGGGTRGWLKEELANATGAERIEFHRKIRQIYERPTSPERWNGFSYATWYSYRGDNTLRALADLDLPMLAILGARDRVIDLRTTIADLILVSEHKPIQLHVFGDCGHHFTKHWPAVSKVLGKFLSELA